MKNKYTISDVADMMGVSRATVSRALSNSPGVGPELRQKIIDFAEKIGYRPNSIAKTLSTGKMNTIGLIYGDVRNPFYADLTYHIQKALNQKGYASDQAGTPEDRSCERKCALFRVCTAV